MSWRDRPYSGDESQGSELRLQFRKPNSVVTWLIVANVTVFVVDLVSRNWGDLFADIFGLSYNGIRSLYLWQLVTYMFMHADPWHLLFNMLGLYIFGMEFYRTFGRERFLQFYAICGIFGGLAYLTLSTVKPGYHDTVLVGASGAIYGLLVAAMIFFPHIQIVMVIFPVPIRVFGLIYAAILLLQLIGPGGVRNPGGELCHIAGAATGVALLYAWGVMPRIRVGSGRIGTSSSEGAWARKLEQLAAEQAEVDRILDKIHHHGLHSLSRSERKTLAEATRHQKEREQEIGRSDRL